MKFQIFVIVNAFSMFGFKTAAIPLFDDSINGTVFGVSERTELTSFKLPNSEIRNLSRNMFTRSPRLQSVTFEFNKFDTLPDELLSNLIELKTVYILHCNLKNVPENLFKNSTNLYDLSIRDNLLTDLPVNFLANQTRLAFINLSGNRFHRFSGQFFANLLTKATWGSGRLYVFFMRNRIDSLSRKHISYMSQFNGYFDFRHNAISDLSPLDTLVAVHDGSFIVLDENPIDCQCESVKAYKRYAAITSDYRRHINGTICATPHSLSGTAVINVDCVQRKKF